MISRVSKTKVRKGCKRREKGQREKGLLSKSKNWKVKGLKSKKQHKKNLETLTGSFLNLKFLKSK